MSNLDLFTPGGGICRARFTPEALAALKEAVRMAAQTRWESIRSPHLFLGLLACPDAVLRDWGQRLGIDLPRLRQQFQEFFHQDLGAENVPLALNREFLSDNLIRVLRAAQRRCQESHSLAITQADLLISLLTLPDGVVGECFDRLGVSRAQLTQAALQAEKGD